MKKIVQDNRRLLDKVLELSHRRGYLIPTAEIYGGFAGVYDWGHLGTLLKRKYERAWRQFFVQEEDNIYEIDGALVLPEVVFEASGHLEGFHDPLTQCTKCNTQFRADHVIQDTLQIEVEGLPPDELTKIIAEHHDVSKHREAIFVGGKVNLNPPLGFFKKLGIEDDKALQSLYSPMEEILLLPEPKKPKHQRKKVVLLSSA